MKKCGRKRDRPRGNGKRRDAAVPACGGAARGGDYYERRCGREAADVRARLSNSAGLAVPASHQCDYGHDESYAT